MHLPNGPSGTSLAMAGGGRKTSWSGQKIHFLSLAISLDRKGLLGALGRGEDVRRPEWEDLSLR